MFPSALCAPSTGSLVFPLKALSLLIPLLVSPATACAAVTMSFILKIIANLHRFLWSNFLRGLPLLIWYRRSGVIHHDRWCSARNNARWMYMGMGCNVRRNGDVFGGRNWILGQGTWGLALGVVGLDPYSS